MNGSVQLRIATAIKFIIDKLSSVGCPQQPGSHAVGGDAAAQRPLRQLEMGEE